LRLWTYRLALAVIVPAALLLGLEGFLRLTGYGHPCAFLIRNGDAIQNNTRFGWRFFPKDVSREAAAIHLAAVKPANTYRVFVLGGSAAQGVPDASYAFGRYVEVMLRERFPAVRFEVVNAAMTAVNSHVMLPVARDALLADPDLFVIYMGNNEIVGPFGPGTAFMAYRPSLSLIRMSLWVKATRIGQLLDTVMAGLRGSSPVRWQGMEMMADRRIGLDDPQLPPTWEHFRRNLQDICKTAHGAGVQVILCTVPVNLRHCAPFASVHRPDITPEDLAAFEQAYDEGILAEAAGQYDQAVDAYLAAIELDDRYADVHFRLARCYLALDRPEEAHAHFGRARETDALRFRADHAINAGIRDMAAQWADGGASLVDAEQVFADSDLTVARSPGETLFYEHVHLTPQGAYLLARAVYEDIVRKLPPEITAGAPPNASILSFEQCAARLALTSPDRTDMAATIWRMIHAPPFTEQLNHTEMRERLLARRQRLWRDAQPVSCVLEACDAAVDAAPDDPWLRAKAAQACLAGGDLTGAADHLRQLLSIAPNDPRAHWYSGRLALARWRMDQDEQALAQADRHFRIYMDLLERRFTSVKNVVEAYSRAGLPGQAEILCRQALADRPEDTSLLNLLATTLLDRRQIAGARRAAQRTVDIDPTSAAGWNTLGLAFLAQGQPAEAVRCFLKATELDPYLVEAFANLGLAQGRTGNPGGAIDSLRRAAELAPGNVAVLERYGTLLEQHGDIARAAAAYRQAMLVQPDDVPTGTRLVWLLATSSDSDVGRPAEAFEIGRRLVDRRPNQPIVLAVFAAASAAHGHFDDAVAAAVKAQQLAEDRGNADLAAMLEQHADHYRQGRPLPPQSGLAPRP